MRNLPGMAVYGKAERSCELLQQNGKRIGKGKKFLIAKFLDLVYTIVTVTNEVIGQGKWLFSPYKLIKKRMDRYGIIGDMAESGLWQWAE